MDKTKTNMIEGGQVRTKQKINMKGGGVGVMDKTTARTKDAVRKYRTVCTIMRMCVRAAYCRLNYYLSYYRVYCIRVWAG